MGTFAISPHFTSEKLRSGRLEDKIDVFEDQMRGWIFSHARALVSPAYEGSRHSGLAVLILACTFFEAFAEFFEGQPSNGQSPRYFGVGFRGAFPDLRAMALDLDPTRTDEILTDVISVFYRELRCGLFHEGMFRSRIVIDPSTANPIQITLDTTTHEVASIILGPEPFLQRVEDTLSAYVAVLRDETKVTARQNFERFWDTRASQPPAIIVPPGLLEQFRIVASESDRSVG